MGNLGIKINFNGGKKSITKEIIKSKILYTNRRVDKLLEQPEVTDRNIKKAAQILTQMCATACLIDNRVFVLMVLKLANLSAKHGNTKYAAVGYAGYALFAGPFMKQYEKAEKLQKIALESSKRYNNKVTETITKFTLGAFVNHWVDDVEQSKKFLKEAFYCGVESGEVLFASFAITMYLKTLIASSSNTKELLAECDYFEEFGERRKFELIQHTIDIVRLSSLSFSDENDGITFQNNDLETRVDCAVGVYPYLALKAQYHYLRKEDQLSFELFNQLYKTRKLIESYYLKPRIIFYYIVTCLKLIDSMSSKEKKYHIKEIEKGLSELKKCSMYVPKNYMHIYLIAKAEYDSYLGNDGARESYSKAISYAIERGNLLEEAIIYELAAGYAMSINNMKLVDVYINRSLYSFEKYGADLKAKQIREQFKSLIRVGSNNDKLVSSYLSTEETSLIIGVLDVFESRIFPTKEKLLNQFVVEMKKITKATKGFIVFEQDDELCVDLNGHIEKLSSLENIAKGILRYVNVTKESVFENIGEIDKVFSDDLYLNNCDKSVICIPLVIRNVAICCIYLEKDGERFEVGQFETANILARQIVYTRSIQEMLLSGKGKKLIEDYDLTDREMDVIHELVKGYSNKEIGDNLNISLSTVKTHLINIYSKLGVNKRVQAVSIAKEMGIN